MEKPKGYISLEDLAEELDINLSELGAKKSFGKKDLKEDILDIKAKDKNSSIVLKAGLFPAFLSAVGGAGIAFGTQNLSPEATIGAALVSAVGFFSMMEGLREKGNSSEKVEKQTKTDSYTSATLGYHTDTLVYSGNPLRVGDLTLKKGDNFLYLTLPYLSVPFLGADQNPTQEQIKAITELNSLVLRDIKDGFPMRYSVNLKGIAVEVPGGLKHADLPSSLDTSRPHKKGDILEGKSLEMDEFEKAKELLFIPIKDFIQIPFTRTLNPQFEAMVNAYELLIGDKIVGKRIIAQLRNLPNVPFSQGYEKARGIKREIDKVFAVSAESMFNGLPNVTMERDENQNPRRIRSDEHPTLRVIHSSKGTFLEQTSYTKGDRRNVVKLDLPRDEILNTDSRYKPLLLSNYLSDVLGDPIALRRAISSTPKEWQVMEMLEKEKMEIYPLDRVGDLPLQNPPYSNVLRKFARAWGIGALASIIVVSAIEGLNALDKKSPADSQSPIDKEYATGATSSGVSEKVGAGFPESVPQSHLDWKIEAKGNIDTNGYYITSTAYDYFQGQFVQSTSKGESTPVELPSIEPSQDHLSITGIINLDLHGRDAKFKLPIRDGTVPAGLKLTNLSGALLNPDSYKVTKLADNTYEVDVNVGTFYPLHSIKATEYLVDAQNLQDSVHAPRPFSSIDYTKLDETAMALLNRSGGNLEGLREQVANKPYSINPDNKDVINHTDGTEEGFVNAAAKLTASDCDLSNSVYVLLASSLPTKDFLNLAFGYLHYTGPGSNTGNFLDAGASHAFTITNKGIIMDATAGNGEGNDEMTQAYLHPKQDANAIDPVQNWDKELESLSSQQQGIDGIYFVFEMGGIIAAGGLGIMTLKEGKRRLLRKKPKILKAREQLRLRNALLGMTPNQLEEAYNFFSWLSFGQPTDYVRQTGFNEKTKAEMTSKIKKDALISRIKEYLNKPQLYESEAGIKFPRRMRRLARYLTS